MKNQPNFPIVKRFEKARGMWGTTKQVLVYANGELRILQHDGKIETTHWDLDFLVCRLDAGAIIEVQ